ncbi:hypothetical protein jhhlp_000821 [Lomentospora prolificans]|uniref:Adenine DNA glycosylase n=1 Tax=Lomentospora prolificans TaxID=41688 RepID=A0A2N3NJK5_9PEZI|nr:hypothetical protein jhhlp_000821 [Lomentospora prolificans]
MQKSLFSRPLKFELNKTMRQGRRKAAQLAASRISTQASEQDGDATVLPVLRNAPAKPQSATRPAAPRVATRSTGRRVKSEDEHEEAPRPIKRRKVASDSVRSTKLAETLFNRTTPASIAPVSTRDRLHAVAYHRPILLQNDKKGKAGRESLLRWFDSVSTARSMPWRKAWIDPRVATNASELRGALERRAYEVWISEIMLQQTRVSVVIDYWNRWMAKWPTIHDLAEADVDEVLLAWRGLGYYSRARRIHEAAQLVVNDADMKGLLPSDPKELESKVPGVGRYTAGAISSIVFGRAVPMVDGNVQRVLSRQLGIYGNVKTDKATIDVMWGAADALVKAVSDDVRSAKEETLSDAPGRWGQALMELGSTICAPKPNCGTCPISSTCLAYQEGVALSKSGGELKNELVDIEDLCTLCEPFEQSPVDEDGDVLTTKKNGANTSKNKKMAESAEGMKSMVGGLAYAIEHARKFPVKTIKKAVREEETVVCALRHPDGRYLIRRRPEKGLLAGLWELPSGALPNASAGKASARKTAALNYIRELQASGHGGLEPGITIKHVGELGSVPWLFSHLKLTMHVQMFATSFPGDDPPDEPGGRGEWRWAESEEIDEESMGTGMRKCWALVREAEG